MVSAGPLLEQTRQAKPSLLTDQEIARLDILAQEVQALLSRVEVLEHRLSILENLAASRDQQTSSLAAARADSDRNNDNDIFKALNHSADLPKVQLGLDKVDYDLALKSLQNNQWLVAEKQFELFIQNYPSSSLQGNAYFWHGETFFRRKIFDKAAISYLKGYQRFPKSLKAADSLLKLALSLGQLNKTAEACRMLSKIEAEFPERPAASIKNAKDARLKFGCK